MDEQTYERYVDRLEQRDDDAILSIALAAMSPDDDAETAIDRAYSATFNALLADERWAKVHAETISEIARDACERAWSQTQAWKGE